MSLSRLLRPTGVLILLALALAQAPHTVTQTPPRQPTPNGTLVSPEILPDRRVTFRIYAPKASSVELRGDWIEGPGTETLTKDDEGVWSVTLGPLTPDFYSYVLTVDGVRTLDPRNPTIKQG
jgi:1,4-alpha-glucan branching enzyme